jgi:PX domain
MVSRMRYELVPRILPSLADPAVRYSEFEELRNHLLAAFPHAKNALPPLPRKSIFCRSHPTGEERSELTSLSLVSQIQSVVSGI